MLRRAKPKKMDWKKNLISRLDFIETYVRGTNPGRFANVDDTFKQDAIKLIARTRRAIDAKRFDAVLRYREVEALYAELWAEDTDVAELDRSEPYSRGGKRHRSHHQKERECALAYINRRRSEDPPSVRNDPGYDARLNQDTVAEVKTVTGTKVDVSSVRRWRRETRAQEVAEMEAARVKSFFSSDG